MLSSFRTKLKLLGSKLRRFLRARPRPKLAIRRLGKWYAEVHPKRTAAARPDSPGQSLRPIRVATFNVAMFSLAPATARTDPDLKSPVPVRSPKGILKTLPGGTISRRSGRKVSINLPENEIALANNKLFAVPARSPLLFPAGTAPCWEWRDGAGGGRSVVEVLREVDADIVALQDVKAEEEKAMRPLSELASALGMKYVFAESWAPEYGNAVLSKWPIKRWRVQKIADNDDFRNVLKAVIEVPWAGEVSIYCTQLDHLDENWRMNQISSFYQATHSPHILAGGINSLTSSDYSSHRWTDILKYYEEMGKPTPKTEVTKFLKGKGYIDSKDYAGECEPVVIVAKGQNVQGTCRYGTRVDYVLSSSDSPYKFVPGSYSVVSSKGTSDHHMVTVDVVKELKPIAKQNDLIKRHKKCLQKLVRCSSKGFWNINA